MKKYTIFLILLVFGCQMMAQTLDTSLVNYSNSSNGIVLNEPNDNVDKTGFGVTTGASFTKVSGIGSYNSTFVSPFFDHRFKNKFNLRGGLTFINSSINSGFQPYYDVEGFNPNSQFVSLYAEGEYQLSEKLHVTGAIRKNIENSPFNSAMMYYMPNDRVSFGLEYKVTENLRIGAEFNMIQHNNRYPYYTPFSDPYLW